MIAAIERYRILLTLRPRDRVPLDWAMTQNNLGNALQTLAARESGTARLEEAIVAWEACLTVVTSNWPPAGVQQVQSQLDWARAENARRMAKYR